MESPSFMLIWRERERERELIKNHVKTLLGNTYKVVHTTMIILKQMDFYLLWSNKKILIRIRLIIHWVDYDYNWPCLNLANVVAKSKTTMCFYTLNLKGKLIWPLGCKLVYEIYSTRLVSPYDLWWISATC